MITQMVPGEEHGSRYLRNALVVNPNWTGLAFSWINGQEKLGSQAENTNMHMAEDTFHTTGYCLLLLDRNKIWN